MTAGGLQIPRFIYAGRTIASLLQCGDVTTGRDGMLVVLNVGWAGGQIQLTTCDACDPYRRTTALYDPDQTFDLWEVAA